MADCTLGYWFLLFAACCSLFGGVGGGLGDAGRKADESIARVPKIPDVGRNLKTDDFLNNFDVCKHKATICKNKGVCVSVGSDEWYCNCTKGFVGGRCEYLANTTRCRNHKCLNGATCYATPGNEVVVNFGEAERRAYQCWCREGFTGDSCELSEGMRLCDEARCHHQGVSDPARVGVNCTCKCVPWAYGEFCEDLMPCADENLSCLSGANCTNVKFDPDQGIPYTGPYVAKCNCESLRTGLSGEFKRCADFTPEHTELKHGCDPCFKNNATEAAKCAEVFLNATLDGLDAPPVNQSSACLSGGVCVRTIRYSSLSGLPYLLPRCECVDELTYGLFCEQTRPSKCVLTPAEKVEFGRQERCLNRARCSANEFIAQGFVCDCPEGYAGDLCQWEDPCSPNPCNGRHCVHLSERLGTHIDLEYACICQPDDLGLNCVHQNYPICRNKPCGKNGTCLPCNFVDDETIVCDTLAKQRRGFACFCEPGLDGTFCDSTYNKCHDHPCLYGATCVPEGRYGFKCLCLAGYTGRYCERVGSVCVAGGVHVCQYGECRDDASVPRGFRCHCDADYEGFDCELVSLHGLSEFLDSYGFVIWPAVMLLISLAFFAVVVAVEQRKRDGGAEPDEEKATEVDEQEIDDEEEVVEMDQV